jgi:SAM-dependent methyltransferase
MGLPVLAAVARSIQAGDVDAEILDMARQTSARYSNITLQKFPAERLPFPDESFDLVLLFEAIYYLSDAGRFLEETRRVLRPGGTLLMVTVNPQWRGFQPSPLKTRYWSAADLLLVLSAGGFTARVQGAFPECSGWIPSALGVLRCAAVGMHLIPRTLRRRAWLKRIFYGRLQVLPERVDESGQPTKTEEFDSATVHRYRVLYASAQKDTK